MKNNPPDVGVLTELTNDLCFENFMLSDKKFVLIIKDYVKSFAM